MAIDFNPENQVGPTVQRWGWDIKGSPNQVSTAAKADRLYGDVPANMIRIPIWVNAHFPDGSVNASIYSDEITSIQNALAENPNVEVFASVKLQNVNTFVGPPSDPNWVTQGTAQWPADTGTIFTGPAPRPNPEFYSQLVADFFDYMDSQGIQIDYLGLNNESDGALGVSRYIDTVDRLNVELANRGYDPNGFRYIGPDSFGPNTAINILTDLSNQGRLDTVDIVGSHQYANRSNTLNHTSDKWQTMSSITGGKDMWHTEVHMNANTDPNAAANKNIILMRGGMGIMFSANMNGVDSFVWWGNGNGTNTIGSTLKREIIKTTQGGHPVESPAFDEQDTDEPVYQAYRQGDLLTIWIAHPALTDTTNLPINFDEGIIATEGSLTVTGEYWQASGLLGNDIAGGAPGSLAFNLNPNNQAFTVNTVPQNSVAKISVVMTGRQVWNTGSGNFDSGFARSDGLGGVGAMGLDPFDYGGTENLYLGNGGFATLDASTDMSSGNAIASLRLGTDQASDIIDGGNGFGVLTVNDAVSLTVGDGNAQVGEVGDFTVAEGGFQGQLNWNSSGTLNVEGKFRVGQGGQGLVEQNGGTIVAGNTAGSDKFVGVGVGPGSDGSNYTLNNGLLIVGGGLTAGQLRELRIGSNASAQFTLGDGTGAAGSAKIETRRHIQVGHNGGTGVLIIDSDGQIEQVTSGAPLIVGASGGSQGTVTQTGGTVTNEHQLRIGDGVGSVGSYTISGGTLSIATDNSGHTRIGENGGTGTLRIEGTASVTAGAELFVGHTDNVGSTGTLELIGSNASLSVANLDNALGAEETIFWQADVTGITPLVVRGDVGSSLFVELQHPMEIAANSGGMGDGIALDLDLSQLAGGGTLTLIDNQSSEAIQGFFENPLVPSDLLLEGELLTGTGYSGTVSISYVGGTGNDVVLLLDSGADNADFNSDNRVDGRDFLTWQRNPSVGSLDDWNLQYGTSSVTAAATSVPEPSTAAIFVALILSANIMRTNRNPS